MDWADFWPYLAVMAGVTYMTRMVPMVLIRKKIKSRFIKSFLCYVPYAVLTAMTVPGILYSTGSLITASAGFAVAIILAWREKPLLLVALAAAAAVFLTQLATGGI
ncbi:MAG: AzlD domain-containing protein [Clostridia bacterium]|nr:AzlD domain-containing protein [Clostridia bacterium]